jgi:hypothetical protein
LTTLTLYSTDQRIDAGGPEIRKGLVSKYGKWVKKNDVADPSPNDPGARQTTIRDGAVFIGVHEGVIGRGPGNTSPAGTKYFQLNYMPQGSGPHIISPGNLEFKKFHHRRHRAPQKGDSGSDEDEEPVLTESEA